MSLRPINQSQLPRPAKTVRQYAKSGAFSNMADAPADTTNVAVTEESEAPPTPETYDLSKLPKKVREAVEKVHEWGKALRKIYFERDDEIHGIIMSLVTRNHVLFVGPHGLAKSELAFAAFKSIEGPRVFEVELTKFDTLEVLFGATDMDSLRNDSEYKHNVKNMLPDTELAVIEEIFDANKPILRSALQVLNERKFTRGQFHVENCPLHTCAATSNFYDDEDEALMAVIDRFMIRCQVAPIADSKNRIKMFGLKRSKTPVLKEKLQWQDILALHDFVMSDVTISEELLDIYDALLVEYNTRMGVSKNIHAVMDRRARGVLRLVKAAAMLTGATEVDPEHLLAARWGFCMVHRENDETQFAEAYKKIVGNRSLRGETRKDLKDSKGLLVRFIAVKDNTVGKPELQRLYSDVRTFIAALEHKSTEKTLAVDEVDEFNKVRDGARDLLKAIADKLK